VTGIGKDPMRIGERHETIEFTRLVDYLAVPGHDPE